MRAPHAEGRRGAHGPQELAGAALALVLAAAVLAVPALGGQVARAWGEPADATGTSGDAVMGELADRYESLDELANSLNSDASVVVETRIGVLNSVNRALDGATVRFSGEAIGNAINADGGHKWVQVADQADSSIAVYLTDELAGKISTYGDYNSTGTTVEVTGEYHVACAQHQGELEVHATRLAVSDAGGRIGHGVRFERLAGGIALCAVGLGLVVLFTALRRRRDRLDERQEGER